jgi:RNA polymerase sigma-70 factor (ECF subfamily)
MNPFPPEGDEVSGWLRQQIALHEINLRAWLKAGFDSRLDLDDIVQEAFLRLWRARLRNELQAPKAFLFATARNLAIDQFRSHRVARSDSLVQVDLSNVLDDNAGVFENVARAQESAILAEAIQALPARCRQIMTLRIVYGLTQKVIGEKLGISDRTVAAQLAIGTRKCSEFLLRRSDTRKPIK